MTDRSIYLDYMATTPIDPRVVEKMLGYMGPQGEFGNSASITHRYGQFALQGVERARQQLADSIHAASQEIIFTSGATEANNLAILGACRFYHRKGKHVITMSTEHKSVLASFDQLVKEGFKVTYLPPQADGLLDLDSLREVITDQTILVSVMHVNNELGVIQDIEEIGKILHNKGIIFHVDAAQSLGKLSIDLSNLGVDLMSFSGHKVYGPKGVGALYCKQKPKVRLEPLSFGGNQESGRRAGTLPTHQIVGFCEAVAIAEACREEEQARLVLLRERLWEGIGDLPGIRLNGHLSKRVAGNLHLTFPEIEGGDLLVAMSELAVSTTSACIAASNQSSYVLRAIGLADDVARRSVRLSLGRFTTELDVAKAIEVIRRVVVPIARRRNE